MKVMAVGDTHGNRGFTKSAITWASENDVDQIVQVGDFGFWPRVNNGQTFLHDVGKHAHTLGVNFSWLDGNHEDHLALTSTIRTRGTGRIVHGKYPLTYLDRGARWEWNGVWFGAFGGAFSIDRQWRTEDSGQYGWFKEEMPDASKIESLGKVDVLFTHDSPIVPPCMYSSGFKRDETSTQSQRTVYDALLSAKPDLLIHGHWHVNEQYKVAGAVMQGLNCDNASLYASAVVFDTEDRKLYSIRQWEHR